MKINQPTIMPAARVIRLRPKSGDIVTFGKYKKQPVSVLADDTSYLLWLENQDWWKKHPCRERAYKFLEVKDGRQRDRKSHCDGDPRCHVCLEWCVDNSRCSDRYDMVDTANCDWINVCDRCVYDFDINDQPLRIHLPFCGKTIILENSHLIRAND